MKGTPNQGLGGAWWTSLRRVQQCPSPLQVFISYRRSDAQSASRQLAEALKLRFGPEDVFFDTRDIHAGVEWKSDTIRRVQESDVVLAIIGPHWAAAADDRARRSVLDRTDEDVRALARAAVEDLLAAVS